MRPSTRGCAWPSRSSSTRAPPPPPSSARLRCSPSCATRTSCNSSRSVASRSALSPSSSSARSTRSSTAARPPARASLLRREATPTICCHIACGMHYLHTLEPPVLHRNLKTQNLLIDEGGRVKICDFGWSPFKTIDSGKTFFHGWQWVAPEILGGARFHEKADVY